LLVLSVVPMLVLFGKDVETVGNLGVLLCGVQLVPLLGSIIPTEIALKRTFDQNGRRRKR